MRAPKTSEISFLHMIAHTPDMFPKIRCSNREIDRVSMFLERHKDELMFEKPDEWADSIAYEEFLGEVKTAWVLKSWIEEKSEDEIIEMFGVEPGDLYQLISTSEWLLYASQEIAKLLGQRDILPKIAELRERVVKGVKPELIPLARLDGVGRVRARIMFNAGFRTIEDLRKASIESLSNLPSIGPRIAKRIKEQVGGFFKREEWERISKAKRSDQQALTEYYE